MNEPKSELQKEREMIDIIDKAIINLMDQRIECVRNILRIKQIYKMDIHQPDREEKILKNVDIISKNPEIVKEIFKSIMNESKKFQEKSNE
jgi:chorismate mutase